MGILGIDLGTTNSLIAYYDENGANIIPNRLGDNLTPSIVSLDENGQIYVGRIAAERLVTYPDRTVAAFKRNMGSSKKFELGDKSFLPEELSSFVVRSLLEDAENYLNQKITEVVISVPAYFNDVQRKATQRAGELAGVKVERIINEPTAAAIAYGLQSKLDHTKFLIVDLGGGTFDVSILELNEGIMEVRGVAGDNFLGGEDFTNALILMFIQKFELDADKMSLRDFAVLRSQAETVKRGLNFTNTISCRIGEKDYEMAVNEADFENICKPLLQRLRRPIERALSDAAIKISEIDDIVLVGGATKLSFIKRFIGRLFKKFPSSNINPEEVVAVGTAMQAAMKERNEHIREIVLTDVCPYTLGTDIAITREGGRIEGGHYLPIIERNTVIPASRSERLYTLHDNQKSIHIKILQGENRFSANNITLGEINIVVPMGPKGGEAVDVRYTYDINGILEVDVTVVSTGVKKRMIIERNPGYMTKEEVEERLKELETIKIHPRDQEKNKLLISRAERLYEENIGDIRFYIGECLKRFEEILDKQDAHMAREAAEIFKEQLNSVDGDWI